MNVRQKTYRGITYAVTQQAIENLKKFHGLDAFEEIENMLNRELEQEEKNDKI
jgi:hypothetical protein